MKIYCPKCSCLLEEFVDEMQIFYECPICDFTIDADSAKKYEEFEDDEVYE